MSVLVLAAAFLGPTTLATAPAEIGSAEIDVGVGLPSVGIPDERPLAFGSDDGRLCILAREGYRLRALYSNDGGRTFEPPVEVAGGEGQPDVLRYKAVLAPDGQLYAVIAVADADAGINLALVRSGDMGQSWSAPSTIARSLTAPGPVDPVPGELPSDGIWSFFFEVAAGPDGLVAVQYFNFHIYVAVSSDFGDSWTTPTRQNAGGAEPWFTAGLAVDPASGRIYTLYSELTSFIDPQCVGCYRPYVRRSTDSGASFEPPVSLSQLVPVQSDSYNPALTVASDGSVLAALLVAPFDGFQEDSIRVARSDDGGQSFNLVTQEAPGGNFRISERFPRLTSVPDGDSVVWLSYVDQAKRLFAARSTDFGMSFGPATALSPSTAVPDGFLDRRHRLVRTKGGRWAVVWTDSRDAATDRTSDIYARFSEDDGTTWSPETKINSASTDPAGSDIPTLTGVGTDDLFVAFEDSREWGGTSTDLYGSRSPAETLTFSADARIDDDIELAQPEVGSDPTLTSDGDQHVYAVFSAAAGAAEPGSRNVVRPMIAATPDGLVYVLYLSRPWDGSEYELRLNVSSDFGASWLASEPVLATQLGNVPRNAIAAIDGGKAFVVWVDGGDLFLSRVNEGMVGMAELLASNVSEPRICGAGAQVTVMWQQDGHAWAATSADEGDTFGEAVQLSGTSVSRQNLALSCRASGESLAVWTSATRQQLFAARFDGANWSGPTEVAIPERLVGRPRATFTDASGDGVVIAYGGSLGGIGTDPANPTVPATYGTYVSRSGDGGVTFPSFQTMYETTAAIAPSPFSGVRVRAVSDLQGNVWVSWPEQFLGTLSILARHSGDGGASFDLPRRMERKNPIGIYSNFYDFANGESAALPGVGLFAWAGVREAGLARPLVNAYDPADEDRDMVPDESDNCPDVANSDQSDNDDDGLGDACDPDDDNDTVADEDDNCPLDSNAGQADTDDDALGNACDNCPEASNPEQTDFDLDTVGDACDNCPSDPNPDQSDTNGNGIGDVCEICEDGDGDGFGFPGEPTCTAGGEEDCDDGDPLVYPGAREFYDGVDNDCDGAVDDGLDDDGDGIPNFRDFCPNTSPEAGVDPNGCAICLVEIDMDGDGFGSSVDCDDQDPAINPAAIELPGTTVDENCDGVLLCDPAGEWSNRGEFLMCVVNACRELVSTGALTSQECARLISNGRRPRSGDHDGSSESLRDRGTEQVPSQEGLTEDRRVD
jgi:hypothetical protein